MRHESDARQVPARERHVHELHRAAADVVEREGELAGLAREPRDLVVEVLAGLARIGEDRPRDGVESAGTDSPVETKAS